jgi:hypothetical protein
MTGTPSTLHWSDARCREKCHSGVVQVMRPKWREFCDRWTPDIRSPLLRLPRLALRGGEHVVSSAMAGDLHSNIH